MLPHASSYLPEVAAELNNSVCSSVPLSDLPASLYLTNTPRHTTYNVAISAVEYTAAYVEVNTAKL